MMQISSTKNGTRLKIWVVSQSRLIVPVSDSANVCHISERYNNVLSQLPVEESCRVHELCVNDWQGRQWSSDRGSCT